MFWGDDELVVHVKVETPPWLSWWALATYVCIGVILLRWWFHTQARKLEQAYSLGQQLQEMDSLKDEFLANTSHELRTPVHGIVGLAESMLADTQDTVSDRNRGNLEMVVASGRRLAALIDDILDFSQLEEEQTQLEPEPVDLAALADQVLALCAPLAGARQLRVENKISLELPAAHGDEGRLHQVLLNLVGNAIKFTESGNVTLTAESVGGQLEVHVSDTGIGIAPENQDQIFQAFRQAEGSTRRLFGGTGLGLSICQRLIGLHGGRLWLESELAKGSTFSFSLPISQAPKTPLHRPALAPTSPPIPAHVALPEKAAPLTIAGMGPHHILVVDDDPVNRAVLVNHLRSVNYQVTEAFNGQQALSLLETESFELVLLDMMMPRVSGVDVCKTLRQSYSASELPVIFLSAREREKDRLGGLEAGANDYLTKPVSRDELLMRIRNQLRLLESTRDLDQLVKLRTRALHQAHEELMQSAHLAGMGELAAEMMHRMGNVLNSLSTSLQVIQEKLSDDKADDLLTRLEENLKEGSKLCRRSTR